MNVPIRCLRKKGGGLWLELFELCRWKVTFLLCFGSWLLFSSSYRPPPSLLLAFTLLRGLGPHVVSWIFPHVFFVIANPGDISEHFLHQPLWKHKPMFPAEALYFHSLVLNESGKPNKMPPDEDRQEFGEGVESCCIWRRWKGGNILGGSPVMLWAMTI